MDKDYIKESLSLEDVTKLVEHLGSAPPKLDRNGNLLFQTICHGGDSHKMYYYEDSKEFHCYTHCQDSFDIYELIMRVKNIVDFPVAVRYVANFFGLNTSTSLPKGFVNLDNKYTSDWDVIERYSRIYDRINSTSEKQSGEIYSNNLLKLFGKKYYQEWIDEGISIESMIKYEIMYRSSDSEIVIPYRNRDGQLIGIRSRTLLKEKIDQGFKYMPTMIQGKFYTHDTSKTLYGLNVNKDSIKRLKKVMLVEGEKSVLKCDTYYGENNFTVGLSGSNFSKSQRSILLELGVREVILALDKPSKKDLEEEDKKEKYIANILKIAHMLSPYMTVYVLWDYGSLLNYKDSPVDQGKDILEILMSQKEEVTSREGE